LRAPRRTPPDKNFYTPTRAHQVWWLCGYAFRDRRSLHHFDRNCLGNGGLGRDDQAPEPVFDAEALIA
jgi:hypothetical protein